MSGAATRQDASKILATVRARPVSHLWREGREMASMLLTPSAALRLAFDPMWAVALNHHDGRKAP